MLKLNIESTRNSWACNSMRGFLNPPKSLLEGWSALRYSWTTTSAFCLHCPAMQKNCGENKIDGLHKPESPSSWERRWSLVLLLWWSQGPFSIEHGKTVSMGNEMHLRLMHICTGLLHLQDLFLHYSIVLGVPKVSFAKLILEMEEEYSLHLQKLSGDSNPHSANIADVALCWNNWQKCWVVLV